MTQRRKRQMEPKFTKNQRYVRRVSALGKRIGCGDSSRGIHESKNGVVKVLKSGYSAQSEKRKMECAVRCVSGLPILKALASFRVFKSHGARCLQMERLEPLNQALSSNIAESIGAAALFPNPLRVWQICLAWSDVYLSDPDFRMYPYVVAKQLQQAGIDVEELASELGIFYGRMQAKERFDCRDIECVWSGNGIYMIDFGDMQELKHVKGVLEAMDESMVLHPIPGAPGWDSFAKAYRETCGSYGESEMAEAVLNKLQWSKEASSSSGEED